MRVYSSAVHSLHIDEGFPDPLLNCLRLQRVVRGIKRAQGSSSYSRLPIPALVLSSAHYLDQSDYGGGWHSWQLFKP